MPRTRYRITGTLVFPGCLVQGAECKWAEHFIVYVCKQNGDTALAIAYSNNQQECARRLLFNDPPADAYIKNKVRHDRGSPSSTNSFLILSHIFDCSRLPGWQVGGRLARSETDAELVRRLRHHVEVEGLILVDVFLFSAAVYCLDLVVIIDGYNIHGRNQLLISML